MKSIDERDIPAVVKQLVQEDLLSHDEYQKILEVDKMALPIIADIIKESKRGQGIKFLPRTIIALTAKLPILMKELKETGLQRVRNELTAVLEELKRQQGIPDALYRHVKKDYGLM